MFAVALLFPSVTVQVTVLGPVQLGQVPCNRTCEPLPIIEDEVLTDHVKVGLAKVVVVVIIASRPS